MVRLFHYWQIPLLSVVIWYGMLIAMLVCWGVQGRPIYWFMNPSDVIVYLSDMGATNLKPLFISCGAAQGFLFVLTLITEAFLRWKGKKLVGYYDKKLPKIAIVGSIFFAILGEVGLVVLAVWDVAHHKKVHHGATGAFIAGIFLCAVCLMIEQGCVAAIYKEKFLSNPDKLVDSNSLPDALTSKSTNSHLEIQGIFHNYLNWAVLTKLIWSICAIAFALSFGLLMKADKDSTSAIFEWITCFWYGILSILFVYDFIPASRYKYKIGFYGQNKYNNNFDYNVLNHLHHFDDNKNDTYF